MLDKTGFYLHQPTGEEGDKISVTIELTDLKNRDRKIPFTFVNVDTSLKGDQLLTRGTPVEDSRLVKGSYIFFYRNPADIKQPATQPATR